MALEVHKLLLETGALQSGHFRLSSGLHSPSYVQCARLLEHPRNAQVLGQALAAALRDLRPTRVVAPALGGVIIGYAVAEALGIPMIFTERKDGAMTLRRGFTTAPNDRIIIVEDVVTTGKSTMETARIVEGDPKQAGVIAFASILNRSGRPNPFDRPYLFLHSMELETYSAEECPLCKSRAPLDSPGSRYQKT